MKVNETGENGKLSNGKRKSGNKPGGGQECPNFCEGWLEKYSLGRSMFSSKGWHRRYFFMSPEGLGYAHKNPREDRKAGAREPPATLLDDGPTGTAEEQRANLRYNLFPYKRPLKPSAAKCFVPFERKLAGAADGQKMSTAGRETALLPVYFLENVDVAQHPEVAVPCRNGICCDRASSKGSTSNPKTQSRIFSSNTAATGAMEPVGNYYYYFALSFEEKKKRYLLLLRTQNVQVYLKFKYYFRLYVHEASRYTLIPVAHPLEVNKAVPTDLNKNRILSDSKNNTSTGNDRTTASAAGNTLNLTEFAIGGSAMQLSYYRDPDPCSHEDLHKIKKLFFVWDDGARERALSIDSGELATLARLLSLPLLDCEAEVQRIRNESAESFYERTSLSAFRQLAADIAEEDYERENREALAPEGGASGGGGPSLRAAASANSSGRYADHSPGTNGKPNGSPMATYSQQHQQEHHQRKAVVYSDTSGEDENVERYRSNHASPRPQPYGGAGNNHHVYTAVYTSNNMHHTRSGNGLSNEHSAVVIADRREANLQCDSARNRILLSSSLGTTHNGIDEGAGLVA